MEQTLSTESSENQVHVFDSMNHSDRVEEPALIIDVHQKYRLDIMALVFKVYWKEVMAMKRFMVPRVAHCGGGH